jgi:hypothetical protein
MKRARGAVRRPYVVRDFEFIREGPEGTLWQAADGMTVQIAAAERPGRRAGESEASDTSHAGHGIPSDSGRRACG